MRCARVALLLLVVGTAYAAPPAIIDWSSQGGHTQNRDGAKDIMYLVQPGDRLTFSVTARDTHAHEWQINKMVQAEAKGETLKWTVPQAKGIWEIHVIARNADGEAHHEWVVSTLTTEEAPDFFDYFADGQFVGRQENDPWGRPLPNWYAVSDLAPPDAGRGYLQPPLSGPPDDEGNISGTLYHPSDIAFGTWKFRYLLPGDRYDGYGGWTHLRFCFIDPRDPTLPSFWYTRSMDGHNYTGLGHINRIDQDMGWVPPRKIWQEVKIIRIRSGDLYTWVDDVFQFRGRELRGQEAASLNLKLCHYRPDRNPEGTICADMVEAHRDRYLLPAKSARYGEYIHDWTWQEVEDPDRWFDFDDRGAVFKVPPRPVRLLFSREVLERHFGGMAYLPVLKTGIVVDGHSVSLRDIAEELRDPALFRYDLSTKTAVCATNLVVSEGAELVIKDETLKFDCRTDGEHEFAVMFGATLRVENSTITTTKASYFVWRFASITHFGYHAGPLHGPLYTGVSYISDLWYHGLCSVFLHKAVIDNCGYLFLSSPMQLDIADTKFTNLREVDTAEYEHVWGRTDYPSGAAKGIKGIFKGGKAFWLGLFGTQMSGFDFRDVSFRGKASPVNLTFCLNDPDYRISVYSVDAATENIVVRKGLRIRGYYQPEECESTLALVNGRFREIVVLTGKARAVVKYYLDVRVVDAQGRPVPDAGLRVTNEVNNAAYPAENVEGKWVIADYVQDKQSKKEFTYTIEAATPDGKRGKVTGVNPDAAWYRPDPGTPTATVKVEVR